MGDFSVITPKMGTVIPANTPVQMATVTDRSGYMHPTWFRFQTQEQEIVRVDIERVMCQETIRYAGIFEKKFLCSIVLENIRYVVEFRYNVESQKWRIFQVIGS